MLIQSRQLVMSWTNRRNIPDDFDAMDCDCETLFYDVDAVLCKNAEGDYGEWDFLVSDLQETDAEIEVTQ